MKAADLRLCYLPGFPANDVTLSLAANQLELVRQLVASSVVFS